MDIGMNDINALYTLWREKAVLDPDLKAELDAVAGQEDEVLDRFYRNLAFGTAGLRGVIGAGTNRMNLYTVNQATQGLADFLNARYAAPQVAIAYDSRIKSDLFAREAAGVLAANGIVVHFSGSSCLRQCSLCSAQAALPIRHYYYSKPQSCKIQRL